MHSSHAQRLSHSSLAQHSHSARKKMAPSRFERVCTTSDARFEKHGTLTRGILQLEGRQPRRLCDLPPNDR
eukprot:6908801-Prymnesium_polylepis.1